MNDRTRTTVWKNYFAMLKGAGLPWGLMIVCFLLSMGIAVFTLMLADQLAIVIEGSLPVNEAVPQILKLIFVVLGGVVCDIAGAHLQGIVTAQVDRNVQKYAVQRVMCLKTADLEAGDTREFITRLVDDTAKNSPFLIELAINEIPRLYYIIAAFISVAKIGQPVLVGTMFLMIPGIFILAMISGRITFANRNRIQARLAAVTAKLAEKIDDVEVIKSYGTEEKEIESGSAVLDELNKVRKEGALVDHINQLISNFIWFIDIVIIVVPPTLLMFKGVIDRGIYASYILLVSKYETSVKEHLKVWVALKEAQGATRRLSAVLGLQTENDVKAQREVTPGDIVFRDVSFAYGENNVLDKVSFTIPRGKKTGIVGLSGSGKSTVLNLIEKFYQPGQGEVCVGGTDIKEADYNGYRGMFAYLPQNAPLVSGTVRELLELGSDHPYSDEEMIQALKDVMLYEDLEALGGLDYEITQNGENLSGGQRQKLGIARMLLQDKEYVLLDEATSALDPEATALIQKRIDKHCEGKTLVVVAHDLSTIENADQILVLDQGRLAGTGSHKELVEKLPLYADLVKGV